MTTKQYLRDDALSGTTTIADVISGEENIIRLTETWFHPQGGGQKADIGTIGAVNVIKVRHAEGGEVDHIVDSVEGITANQNVLFAIDAKARLINAAYHTVGHLIAHVGDDACPSIKGVQGHHWPGEARVDFDGEAPDIEALKDQIMKGVQKAIDEDMPTEIVGDPFTDRKLKVGGWDAVGCGGTHLKSLGVIAKVEIGKIKVKKGQTRVRYEVEVKDNV